MLLQGYAKDDDDDDCYTGYQFMNLGILEATDSSSSGQSFYSDDDSYDSSS